MESTSLLCPVCHFNITSDIYFCPNCGKKLKEKPLATTALKQTSIYFISLLAPPMGLWYGYKYFKQNDNKSKIVGTVAAALTIISLIVTIKLTMDVINSVNQTMNQYQNLGF